MKTRIGVGQILLSIIFIAAFIWWKVSDFDSSDNESEKAQPEPAMDTEAEKLIAEAREIAERKKKLRDSKFSAWTMSKEFVKKSLKSPSTADFGGIFDGNYQNPEEQVQYKGNDEYFVTGWVDSQNSFGAMIRTKWAVKIKDLGNDKWAALDGPHFE